MKRGDGQGRRDGGAGPARRHQDGRDDHAPTRAASCRSRVRRRPSRCSASGSVLKDRKDEVKLVGCARQADGGGSFAAARAEPRHASDAAAGPGRDAPARRHRAAAAQVRRRGRAPAAAHPLQGDDPQGDGGARAPQEAVGRPRPVRRRGDRDRAAAARLRLPVRRRRSRAASCRASSFRRSRSA